MIVLENAPSNRDHFARLSKFGREVVDICGDLGVAPVLYAGLAAFAYTRDTGIAVHDLDLLVPEARYPEITRVLEERGIEHVVREWHVLQVLRGDLKIELDSMEFWSNVWQLDLPEVYDTLRTVDFVIRIMPLDALKQTYKFGSELGEDEPKSASYRLKYEALNRLGSKRD
jgi:hypothetical protein